MRLISPVPVGSSNWLLRLRSFATIGQLVTITLAHLFTPASLPIFPLCVLVLLTATTNFGYGLWLFRMNGRKADQGEAGEAPLRVAFALMALDLITLTAMLYFAGGADNPFCFFYFVNLAVGGVMLQRRAAWALAVLALLGYITLLITSLSVRGLSVRTVDEAVPLLGSMSMRDIASLVAFAACSAVVTYFVTQTSRALREREFDLLRSQSERADAVRLEGLTTLAAGAAHELATPLSAINVACRELTRHLEAVEKPQSIDDDLQLIDGQLHMCRQILSRMRSAAGDAVADQWNRTTLGDLIDTVLEGIRDPHRVEVLEPDSPWIPDESHHAMKVHRDTSDWDEQPQAWESQPMWLPQEAVAQAIRNLIHNALDASEHEASVTLQAQRLGREMALYVVDQGHGMSDNVLDRAGEPFFTTKEPGRGIGLGLFLTRNVITRLGGRLSFESNPGSGTIAKVILPLPSV